MQALNEVVEGEADTECKADKQPSLNAMWGFRGTQTMRMTGKCQKRRLPILIDTVSTHNFLREVIASKIKLCHGKYYVSSN